jgi:nucleoside-diphosphate-sugar epimerase
MTQRSARGRARKKAVVAGALGVSGRGIVNQLAELGDWEIVGLSRRSPDFTTSARSLAVDLLDRADVERHLDALRDVTHVFYAALQMRPDPLEDVEVNLSMLRQAVETIERASGALRKVVLMEERSTTAPTWAPT